MQCDKPGQFYCGTELPTGKKIVVDLACWFCGEKADAGWITQEEALIGVCSRCAIDTLPALIADAISLPHPSQRSSGGFATIEADHLWMTSARAAFLRALSLRLERQAREATDETA